MSIEQLKEKIENKINEYKTWMKRYNITLETDWGAYYMYTDRIDTLEWVLKEMNCDN